MESALAVVHPTVRCSYVEDIGSTLPAIQDGIESFFGELLRYDPRRAAPDTVVPSTPAGVASMAGTIAQAILAPARPHGTPEALDINRSVIVDRVEECIRRSISIPAQMLWSPKKHWVVGADSDVDLAELTALKTLLAVHNSVRAIYPPGLTFVLHLEDLEFEFMEGAETELNESRDRYIAGLRRVIRVLELNEVFTAVRISEKAADEETLHEWFSQMAANYRALETYWYESDTRGMADRETYPSFLALRRLGWHGSIPEEMRNHYLKRLTAARERPHADKVRMILRNFAGILLHHQKNLLHTGSDVEPIKFSFIPPAPGAPAQLTRGRADLRFVSRTICSRVGAAGPWSTKGYFRSRDGRIVPAFTSWHGQMDPRSRFVQGHLTLTGHDQDVNVRADVLLGS